MRKRFAIKPLFIFMATTGSLVSYQLAQASAFQLWEQDAATIGNYHAGYTSEAADASTGFYNPAGLVRIKNQQIVAGGDAVLTNIKYKGTVNVDTLIDPLSNVVAQGGGFSFVPFGHYAAPLTENLVFGLSAVVPFGLKTDYGTETNLKYAATLSSVQVIDLSPELGFKIGDKFSFGLGFDAERMSAQFNQYGTSLAPINDTESNNSGHDWAYGYHLGALYQFDENNRVGISYHSQVVHHLRGTSKFIGPLANASTGGEQISNQLHATTTLPPSTSLSFFHTINPKWDVMGSVTYVQWSVFKKLVLQNVAAVSDGGNVANNNLVVTVAEGYHNVFGYSLGANYHVNDQWMLRTGAGFENSPANGNYRNVQLPDSDRIAVALGTHFQATKTVGFDAGWTHVFSKQANINNLAQPVGDETVTTNGTVYGSADVYGLQVKWDIL